MKKTHFIILITFIISCSQSIAQIDFSGKYSFSENLGQTVGGTGINYYHTIDIFKENGQYKATYSIDGYQTLTRLECSVMEVKINASAPANSLILQFEKYGADDLFKNKDLYKPKQDLLEIAPKGGIMAKKGETQFEVTYMPSSPHENKANQTFIFDKE